MTMRWLPVVGYEGLYEVNEAGAIRSLPRGVRHYTGKVLQRKGRMLGWCSQHGYAQVTLSKDGTCRAVRVHAIVAAAFLGPRPAGTLIRHRDGNRLNNYYKNLRYGTSQENSDDMQEHGTVLRGEDHGRARLTEAQVRDLRAHALVHTRPELVVMFGISRAQVDNIIARRQWHHV